jgi:hypothetical protein
MLHLCCEKTICGEAIRVPLQGAIDLREIVRRTVPFDYVVPVTELGRAYIFVATVTILPTPGRRESARRLWGFGEVHRGCGWCVAANCRCYGAALELRMLEHDLVRTERQSNCGERSLPLFLAVYPDFRPR